MCYLVVIWFGLNYVFFLILILCLKIGFEIRGVAVVYIGDFFLAVMVYIEVFMFYLCFKFKLVGWYEENYVVLEIRVFLFFFLVFGKLVLDIYG